MNLKKTIVASVMPLCLVMSQASATQQQAEIVEPRYVSVSSIRTDLEMESLGRAVCTATIKLKSGYHAQVGMTLYQDGSAVTSWTDTCTSVLQMEKSYFVRSGYTYTVTTQAMVYDSSNQLVEKVSVTSKGVSY